MKTAQIIKQTSFFVHFLIVKCWELFMAIFRKWQPAENTPRHENTPETLPYKITRFPDDGLPFISPFRHKFRPSHNNRKQTPGRPTRRQVILNKQGKTIAIIYHQS